MTEITLTLFQYSDLYRKNPTIFAPPPVVPMVQVEPTNHCNLQCIMCPRSVGKYPKGYMDKKLFFKIIDQLPSLSLIKFFLFGEPLLHPDVVEMLTYAFNKAVIVDLATNAQLLDENMARKLIPVLRIMGVSIDAVDAETYEKIRCGGSFKRLVDNLERFVKIKEELKPPVFFWGIQGIRPKGEDEDTCLRRLKNLWGHLTPNVKALEHTDYDGTFWINSKNEIISSKVEGVRIRRFCRVGLQGLVVRWDGKIGFCCGDFDTEAVLGNAWVDNLNDVWSGDKLRNIHSDIRRGNYESLPMCQKCGAEGREPLQGEI